MAKHEGAEHHKKAAEHHEHAARYHLEATKHHESGCTRKRQGITLILRTDIISTRLNTQKKPQSTTPHNMMTISSRVADRWS
jgi:hypothetical protein